MLGQWGFSRHMGKGGEGGKGRICALVRVRYNVLDFFSCVFCVMPAA